MVNKHPTSVRRTLEDPPFQEIPSPLPQVETIMIKSNFPKKVNAVS